ncbi:transcriptional regulator [Iodidimonas nitroreducens]|uniref:Transcriptional regulator n=2 Tax=Iodidimonas nitroreducens TaxID=1236968 RepID=A0A5A7N7B4_9PROT|nr:putative HTH-type transcriptional regulator YdhC [alpha proteobacterium Q-1]GER04191.1 transcriptional regulator [Iodidimonas nitroreducens]
MATAMKETIPRQSLHKVVADRLREMIIEGELAPEERLKERVLCERFGISRTPLREAIKMLSLEGFVQLLPNRGAEVTSLTWEEAEDMFQIMSALESLGGELACRRATDDEIDYIRTLHMEMFRHFEAKNRPDYYSVNQEIHETIIRCSRNRELETTYNRIAQRIRRGRYMANFSEERWAQAMQEHEQILHALMKRDSHQLGEILKTHLENKLIALRRQIGGGQNNGL